MQSFEKDDTTWRGLFGTQTANAHIPNYTFPSIGNQDFILALYIKFN